MSTETVLDGCAVIETDKQALTLTTDDGRTLRCQIVRLFHTPAQDYIVLLPEEDLSAAPAPHTAENTAETGRPAAGTPEACGGTAAEEAPADGRGWLFRFALAADGGPLVTPIPTDEEYSRAAAIFNALSTAFTYEEGQP